MILLFCFLTLPCQARPKVLVILADHLTRSNMTDPGLPNLVYLRQSDQMSLMSPGLAQGADPVANVYATLGAGDAVKVGNVSQGLMGRTLREAGIRAALIGNADGDDTGVYRPALQMLPAPDEIASDDGTMPDPTAAGGRRIDPARLWAQTQTALQDCDLVVVQDGDFARAERENARGFLMPMAYQAHRQKALASLDAYLGYVLQQPWHGNADCMLLLVSPVPPLTANGGWNQLTPILLRVFPEYPGRISLLSSETTQTPGLIAARDIAPSILYALHVPAPIQMTGAFVIEEPTGNVSLQRLDRLTMLNQEVQNPFFWSLGACAVIIIFGGLGVFLSGRLTQRSCPLLLYGLRLLSAWPLALLLAPLANPLSGETYLGWIIGITTLLALLPSPDLIFFLTVVALILDCLTGTRLVAQSLLSAYYLAGIRFYGIGNEYMGVLLGGALLASIISIPRRGKAARPAAPGGIVLWFALVTFVLSFPAYGAKAGGAVTATATFTLAWLRLRGVPFRLKYLFLGLSAGFALVLVWTVVGHIFGVRRTHMETAVGALGQGRFGYIVGVALRKIGLAVHVTLLPGTLLGVLGFVLLGLLGWITLQTPLKEYLEQHRSFAAVWEAGLWGSAVCILFNDSGIVAAILLLACLVLSLLHGLLLRVSCASSPSISATPASASPSATA